MQQRESPGFGDHRSAPSRSLFRLHSQDELLYKRENSIKNFTCGLLFGTQTLRPVTAWFTPITLFVCLALNRKVQCLQ